MVKKGKSKQDNSGDLVHYDNNFTSEDKHTAEEKDDKHKGSSSQKSKWPWKKKKREKRVAVCSEYRPAAHTEIHEFSAEESGDEQITHGKREHVIELSSSSSESESEASVDRGAKSARKRQVRQVSENSELGDKRNTGNGKKTSHSHQTIAQPPRVTSRSQIHDLLQTINVSSDDDTKPDIQATSLKARRNRITSVLYTESEEELSDEKNTSEKRDRTKKKKVPTATLR